MEDRKLNKTVNSLTIICTGVIGSFCFIIIIIIIFIIIIIIIEYLKKKSYHFPA